MIFHNEPPPLSSSLNSCQSLTSYQQRATKAPGQILSTVLSVGIGPRVYCFAEKGERTRSLPRAPPRRTLSNMPESSDRILTIITENLWHTPLSLSGSPGVGGLAPTSRAACQEPSKMSELDMSMYSTTSHHRDKVKETFESVEKEHIKRRCASSDPSLPSSSLSHSLLDKLSSHTGNRRPTCLSSAGRFQPAPSMSRMTCNRHRGMPLVPHAKEGPHRGWTNNHYAKVAPHRSWTNGPSPEVK